MLCCTILVLDVENFISDFEIPKIYFFDDFLQGNFCFNFFLQFPNSRVVHDFRHEIFGVKFFCYFFWNIDFSRPSTEISYLYLIHFNCPPYLFNLPNSYMFTNHQSPQILIFRSLKVVFFMILGMKILKSKFFVSFSWNIDFARLFTIISLFYLPSIFLKRTKYIHVLKLSKHSNIDFQITKNHVFHDFGHENFRVKIFREFF